MPGADEINPFALLLGAAQHNVGYRGEVEADPANRSAGDARHEGRHQHTVAKIVDGAWGLPEHAADGGEVDDEKDGRDYKRGIDSNVKEKNEIISNIIENLPSSLAKKLNNDDIFELQKYLSKSKIKDITEYGRVVHAEMEALLACARNNIPTLHTTLFCTTFPCHNCAKHIIASGVKKVIYIEPYPKSKAIEFHSDSIALKDTSSDHKKVIFEATFRCSSS